MPLREIGSTGIQITPVAMGCWPIAGVTSIHVTEENSLATLQAAADAGITHFDTAWIYGYEGESEKLIGRALGHRRDEITIASKGGIHWENREQAHDARPETIRAECEGSLKRLGTDRIDLYYLHSPDPAVPLAETAGVFRELLDEGKIRSVGVSNCRVPQLEEFSSVCPLSASQPPYNMLQRHIEEEHLPWCREHNVSLMIYWPLMKGLLAGKLARDHQFEPQDGRQKLPMFQGEEWEKTQDLLDVLREVAAEAEVTVAQLVIHWTISQPGITAALCGAKRPEQIIETAAAMNVSLTASQQAWIDQAVAERGSTVLTRPV